MLSEHGLKIAAPTIYGIKGTEVKVRYLVGTLGSVVAWPGVNIPDESLGHATECTVGTTGTTQTSCSRLSSNIREAVLCEHIPQ